jgi:hypothetical protein
MTVDAVKNVGDNVTMGGELSTAGVLHHAVLSFASVCSLLSQSNTSVQDGHGKLDGISCQRLVSRGSIYSHLPDYD